MHNCTSLAPGHRPVTPSRLLLLRHCPLSAVGSPTAICSLLSAVRCCLFRLARLAAVHCSVGHMPSLSLSSTVCHHHYPFASFIIFSLSVRLRLALWLASFSYSVCLCVTCCLLPIHHPFPKRGMYTVCMGIGQLQTVRRGADDGALSAGAGRYSSQAIAESSPPPPLVPRSLSVAVSQTSRRRLSTSPHPGRRRWRRRRRQGQGDETTETEQRPRPGVSTGAVAYGRTLGSGYRRTMTRGGRSSVGREREREIDRERERERERERMREKERGRERGGREAGEVDWERLLAGSASGEHQERGVWQCSRVWRGRCCMCASQVPRPAD